MNSPNYPYSAFPEPIPVPTSDRGDFCFTVDGKWIPYILGALFPLAVERTWEENEHEMAHQGLDLLSRIMAAKRCEVADITGAEIEDDEMKLRFCGGKLQFCDCGAWTDVPDCDGQGQTTPTTGQPGAGSPQPPAGGGTQRYCGAMAGKSHWYLPTTVSTGDVLLFHDLAGAWQDTGQITWHCPDGWVFFDGGCFDIPLYNTSGDPLIGTKHMSIVALIGSDYYDVLNVSGTGAPQSFIVPAGISNQPVTLLANNDPSFDINGEVSFCVDVTNNAAALWVSDMDFTGAPYFPLITSETDISNNYTPGLGFYGVLQSGAPTYIQIRLDIGATHITGAKLFYDSSYDGTSGQDVFFQADGSTYGPTPLIAAGTNQVLQAVADVTLSSNLRVVLNGGQSGATALKRLIITGTGPKPTTLP